MVMMKDAPVLLHGVVLVTEHKRKFDNPNQADGVVVTLSSNGGFANVKIRQDVLGSVNLPAHGDRVAMIAAPYAYAQQQGMGNMGFSFQRYADEADVQEILSHLLTETAGK